MYWNTRSKNQGGCRWKLAIDGDDATKWNRNRSSDGWPSLLKVESEGAKMVANGCELSSFFKGEG